MEPSLPASGWYPNPDGTPTLLWWSGSAWVGPPQPLPPPSAHHRVPTTPPPPGAVPPPPPPPGAVPPAPSLSAPTPPPTPREYEARGNADIASILLSVGAIAVLVGGLSFSGNSAAKYLLPVLVAFFVAGAAWTYRKQLRISAEIFASVAIGLGVYELWIVFQPHSYGNFGQVLRSWGEGDGATLGTIGALAGAVGVLMAGLTMWCKAKNIALRSPAVWVGIALFVGAWTALVHMSTHDVDYFEVYTIPLALVAIAAGEYVLRSNEKATSLGTVTWGLLIGFIPTGFAAYGEVLSHHALVLTLGFVAAVIYGVVCQRKAAFFVAPWFFIVYCLCAIVSVGEDVKPWVWLMIGGVIVIGCGVFWEQLYREAKQGRDRLQALR